jgi:hypothetical protein
VRVALLDRAPERRSGRQQPVLADELIERVRPQAGCQRSVGRSGRPTIGRNIVTEQALHA